MPHSPTPVKELIDCIQSLHPLSSTSLSALLSICKEVFYKKNTVIQEVGTTSRSLFFIKKGALRVYYVKGKKEIADRLAFENTFFANIQSMIPGMISHKGMMALEDSELIEINVDELGTLYDEHRDIERLFTMVLINSFIKALKRIDSLQFYSAETRYLNLIKEHPDMLKRVQLKYIASYLGITQVSLSRIRAKY